MIYLYYIRQLMGSFKRKAINKMIQSQERNITVYTNSDFPSGTAPENFVRQMALGLTKNEANVRVIRLRGRPYGGENYTNIHCSNLLLRVRPKHDFLKFFELILIISYIPLSVFIDKLKRNTEVILLYGIEYSYFNISFLLIAKILNIKIIRIVADHYESKSIVPIWWKKPKVFFYRLQFKYFDRFFDGLIILSSFLEKQALINKVNPNKILLLPNFIDLSHQLYKNLDSTEIKICFTGLATIDRGFFDLFEAFRILLQTNSNIRLIISGNLPGYIISSLQPYLIDFKNKIHFTGYLSNEELIKLQQSCDIFVNPPRNTIGSKAAFPTKLGEYFATAKPVVSTRTGDIEHYFTNKCELVLVEPGSPKALAEGIGFLLKNKEEAIIIGQNGYLWGKKNLDYITNAQKLLSFIRNL